MILELARLRSFDRPMSRVVDARRHLVGEQSSIVLEQLDRQHADVIERFQRPRGDGGRFVGERASAPTAPGRSTVAGSRRGGRSRRAAKTPFRRCALRAARIDSSRSNGTNPSRSSGRPPIAANAGSTILGAAQHALPLAVVPCVRVLSTDGRPIAAIGAVQLVTRVDGGETAAVSMSSFLKRSLSLRRSCATSSAFGGGKDGDVRGEPFGGGDRNVLELVRDEIDRVGERVERRRDRPSLRPSASRGWPAGASAFSSKNAQRRPNG